MQSKKKSYFDCVLCHAFDVLSSLRMCCAMQTDKTLWKLCKIWLAYNNQHKIIMQNEITKILWNKIWYQFDKILTMGDLYFLWITCLVFGSRKQLWGTIRKIENVILTEFFYYKNIPFLSKTLPYMNDSYKKLKKSNWSIN